MKKFIFTPMWKIEQTEKLLAEYEKEGFRFTSIRFPYIFEFKESKPKNALYFITKYYQESSDTSINLDLNLTVEHHCSPIGKFEPHTGYNVFRTLKTDDFTEFKRMRADFFRRLYRSILIGDLVFLVWFVVMFILSLHGNNGGNGNALFISVFVFLILSSAYSLFGYLKERKAYNYYNKIYKDNKKASE
ncbi:MAG: hypothetical protein MJ168_00105 [Clostridia bacterium]|nr:hypothetical protein [Clostridia bacterium]